MGSRACRTWEPSKSRDFIHTPPPCPLPGSQQAPVQLAAGKMLQCLSFPTGGNLGWEQSAGKALPMGSGGEAANASPMPAAGARGQGHLRGPAPAWQLLGDMSPMSTEVRRLGHAVSQHATAQTTATAHPGAEKPLRVGEPSLPLPSPATTGSSRGCSSQDRLPSHLLLRREQAAPDLLPSALQSPCSRTTAAHPLQQPPRSPAKSHRE